LKARAEEVRLYQKLVIENGSNKGYDMGWIASEGVFLLLREYLGRMLEVIRWRTYKEARMEFWAY